MLNGKHTTAMIPARMGSQRLAQKNLIMLDGEPMIGHAIKAAKESGVFDKIVINSEGEVFAEIADLYGIDFYHRPEQLATSETQSDDVVNDFIENNPTDIIAWVNSIAPLQPSSEVREIITHFEKEDLDSLVTTREEQVHCNYKGGPLNYDFDEKFARTQDLDPVDRFVYSIMVWKTESFTAHYRDKGYAMLFGRVGFYPVSRLSSTIIKREEDIRMCEYLLASLKENQNKPLEYFKSVKS